MILLKEVAKKFGSHPAVVEGLNLQVAKQERVSLLGPSGCGKTTVLRLMAGLEQPSAGTIQVLGVTPLEACRSRKVGVAFQRPALIPSLTVADNIRLTLEVAGCDRGAGSELLREVGLADFADYFPHQISGGMQQRVNIACALAHRPDVLFLDEPFGALDEITRASMWDWLSMLLGREQKTAVLVTHCVEEAVALTSRVLIFAKQGGRVVREVEVPRLFHENKEARLSDEFAQHVAEVRRALHSALEGKS
jgi:NitT/TauT family transport system ATP-binding protein